MTYTVKIAGWDKPVTVELGQTILDAAIGQGVPYPHGCRSGNCGACRSRLISGDVEMAPFSEFALTGDEIKAGLVLACRSVPWEDIEIAWLDEDEFIAHPIRHMTCRVAALDDMNHDIKRIRMEIQSGGPFRFSAGQYCSLSFAGQDLRDYSMANTPDEAILEFHIRHVPDGASSEYVAQSLVIGEEVLAEGPFGSCWLREAHRGPIIALAGGSGLAPIKSMVEHALSLGMAQDIHLYFGVREERDLYLEDHFDNLQKSHSNLNFVPVLSEVGSAVRSTERRTGFIDEAVATDFADLDGFKAYLAGPPPMVEAATAMLLDRGARREDIHADAFYTEEEKAILENRR